MRGLELSEYVVEQDVSVGIRRVQTDVILTVRQGQYDRRRAAHCALRADTACGQADLAVIALKARQRHLIARCRQHLRHGDLTAVSAQHADFGFAVSLGCVHDVCHSFPAFFLPVRATSRSAGRLPLGRSLHHIPRPAVRFGFPAFSPPVFSSRVPPFFTTPIYKRGISWYPIIVEFSRFSKHTAPICNRTA